MAFAAPDVDAADLEALARVLSSKWLTTGVECEALEHELSAEVAAPFIIAVSSCTAALEIALAFLDLPAGSRVGVPTWTFVSTALAAHRAGALVVLVDVDPNTLNMAPDSLSAALVDGLDVVIPVHFGGVPVSPDIRALCYEHGVEVVEDAAHALGASDDRGPVNGHGVLAACYSFYATKNLSCGEGGAIATFSEELATFSRSYRLHGLSKDAWRRYLPDAGPDQTFYDLLWPGIKANLPDLLAALARSQLSRFRAIQHKRRVLVQHYRRRLVEVTALRMVPETLIETGADHLMVAMLPCGVDRTVVVEKLAKAGIPTSVHFRPLHRFEWIAGHSEIGRGGIDVAESLADRALSLPLHTGMSMDDVDRVADALAAAV